MTMYLVTWEHADDGMWSDNPEGFDSRLEAKEFAFKAQARLTPGNCLAIYRCELVETLDGPAISQAQGGGES